MKNNFDLSKIINAIVQKRPQLKSVKLSNLSFDKLMKLYCKVFKKNSSSQPDKGKSTSRRRWKNEVQKLSDRFAYADSKKKRMGQNVGEQKQERNFKGKEEKLNPNFNGHNQNKEKRIYGQQNDEVKMEEGQLVYEEKNNRWDHLLTFEEIIENNQEIQNCSLLSNSKDKDNQISQWIQSMRSLILNLQFLYLKRFQVEPSIASPSQD